MDDASDDPEDYLRKWKRPSKEEEDCLSVHADETSESELDNLLNEQPSKVTDQSNDEDEFLQDLASAFEADEATGTEIKPQLADIANKSWSGKKISTEKLKPILDKYKNLANCTNISAIKVNPEIWAQTKPYQKTGDLALANM